MSNEVTENSQRELIVNILTNKKERKTDRTHMRFIVLPVSRRRKREGTRSFNNVSKCPLRICPDQCTDTKFLVFSVICHVFEIFSVSRPAPRAIRSAKVKLIISFKSG